jgi:hypothetical protein
VPTTEIPRYKWPAFFDSFSGQHEGWLARVEIVREGFPTEIAVDELPLEGISADLKDKEQTISIRLGDDMAECVSVENPQHVVLEQTDEGADRALEIDSADGRKTMVRFRTTLLPENVDGLMTD